MIKTCTKCKSEKTQQPSGKWICRKCYREHHSEYLFKTRNSQGRCLDCGGVPQAGRKLCAECQAINSRNRTLRRRATKKYAVDLFGRKCVECGKGKKYIDALFHFHHIDPKLKTCSTSEIFGMPRERAIFELKVQKCILLCGSCHTIKHNSISTASSDM